MRQAQSTSRPASSARGRTQRPENEVIQALRRDILARRLKPRERLVEEELCERFGVGRYVVRMALDELVRIGLLVKRPNRGVHVVDFSPEEVEQLYDVRAVLQKHAVQRFVLPAEPGFVERLRSINERYRAAIEDGSAEDLFETNAEFHRTLFSLCGNPHLVDAIEQFRERTAVIHGYVIGMPDMAARSLADHDEMIACLESGDRDRLATLCFEHMQPALSALRSSAALPGIG